MCKLNLRAEDIHFHAQRMKFRVTKRLIGEPDIESQVTPEILLANTSDTNVVLSPDVSLDLELQSELTASETDMEFNSLIAIINLLSTLGFPSQPTMSSSQSGTSSQLVITTAESFIGEFRILAFEGNSFNNLTSIHALEKSQFI
jgi:hypothetical protein